MEKEEGRFVHVMRLSMQGRIVIGRGTGNTPAQALSAAAADVLPLLRGRRRRKLLLCLAAQDPELLFEIWENRRF